MLGIMLLLSVCLSGLPAQVFASYADTDGFELYESNEKLYQLSRKLEHEKRIVKFLTIFFWILFYFAANH